MRKLLMIVVIVGSAGCSNKAMYNQFLLDERIKCAEAPSSTYFDCLERTNKSFEEYQRERKEITERQKRIDVGGGQKNIGAH